MKYIISLFWAFIFSLIAIFIISSVLGSNGLSGGNMVRDSCILSIIFTAFVAILEAIGFDKKRSENK